MNGVDLPRRLFAVPLITTEPGISQPVVESALRPISLIEHEGADLRTAGLFKDRSLGSLDALHLATALRSHADAMLTTDQALARASESEGIPILTIPNV